LPKGVAIVREVRMIRTCREAKFEANAGCGGNDTDGHPESAALGFQAKIACLYISAIAVS
jgi:hypothetical protein